MRAQEVSKHTARRSQSSSKSGAFRCLRIVSRVNVEFMSVRRMAERGGMPQAGGGEGGRGGAKREREGADGVGSHATAERTACAQPRPADPPPPGEPIP